MKQKKGSTTIRDVANLAGVSVATISRYMNNPALVSSETAVKVQSAMTQLNFVPNPVARNLSTNRTNTIGLIINDLGGEFFTPLLDGIIDTTEKNNFNLLMFTSKRSDHYSHALLGPKYTDGLLIFLDSLAEDDIRRLHASGHPMVLIHQSAPLGLQIPMVTIENKAASNRIVSHLIEKHGRKRIVFLKGPEHNEDSYWRETGYREALLNHNIPIDPALIMDGGFDRYEAKEAISKLLGSKTEFDGVFAGDDEAAIGVLQALKEAEKNVPGEIAVVGFDDQQLAAFLHPRLTTVHAPTDQVGMLAARQLLKIIRNEPAEEEILLPTELVFRESCGC